MIHFTLIHKTNRAPAPPPLCTPCQPTTNLPHRCMPRAAATAALGASAAQPTTTEQRRQETQPEAAEPHYTLQDLHPPRKCCPLSPRHAVQEGCQGWCSGLVQGRAHRQVALLRAALLLCLALDAGRCRRGIVARHGLKAARVPVQHLLRLTPTPQPCGCATRVAGQHATVRHRSHGRQSGQIAQAPRTRTHARDAARGSRTQRDQTGSAFAVHRVWVVHAEMAAPALAALQCTCHRDLRHSGQVQQLHQRCAHAMLGQCRLGLPAHLHRMCVGSLEALAVAHDTAVAPHGITQLLACSRCPCCWCCPQLASRACRPSPCRSSTQLLCAAAYRMLSMRHAGPRCSVRKDQALQQGVGCQAVGTMQA
mmetsp:Transcript_28869/g.77760  ORF Transcript_28869/g.77760 Transcript_28869/m.77760 type:complete len:366 (+) Transcript_28869:606-1703(+)